MFFEVIPTEIFGQKSGILTYSSTEPLSPGHIVLIPLGRRIVTGVVFRHVKSVDFPTKPIIRTLHPIPVPKHLLDSARWLSEYYLSPLAATVNLMIPAGLTSKTALKTSKISQITPQTSKPSQIPPKTIPKSPLTSSKSQPAIPPTSNSIASPAASQPPQIALNKAQKTALQALREAPGHTSLLRGITGSGKTNIYLEMAKNTLEKGKSVILLVPEIALTSQLVQIFEQTFGRRIILMHSKQTMAERRAIWLQIHESTSAPLPQNSPAQNPIEAAQNPTGTTPNTSAPLVIIGPRSALLAPVHNLGLIIIDESHESSYYQENTPHYSAPRLASFMAKTLKIPCLLGSATPSIVDYYLAKSKGSLVELSSKAKSTAIAPTVHLVDFKDRASFLKSRYFSNQLLSSIQKNLENHHQTLIFHNRRGSAPLTLCEHCGWQALCPNCYLPMALHTDTYTLRCHLCGHEEKVPKSCPSCGHPEIIHKGFGTKLLESELSHLFPDAKIARFDGDNRKNEDLASLYDDIKSGEIDILIGTQTLARGLDLPLLATVGIVQADAGLALPDFAAEERTFELLTQVIGRVGRGHLDKAEVIAQTYQPSHPVLTAALTADFPGFADYLLKNRRAGHLPPFTHLARLSITYKTEKTTITKIKTAYNSLLKFSKSLAASPTTPSNSKPASKASHPLLEISPPMPAFHEHIARGYTWQLIIKSRSRTAILEALSPFVSQPGISITLDPPSLL